MLFIWNTRFLFPSTYITIRVSNVFYTRIVIPTRRRDFEKNFYFSLSQYFNLFISSTIQHKEKQL